MNHGFTVKAGMGVLAVLLLAPAMSCAQVRPAPDSRQDAMRSRRSAPTLPAGVRVLHDIAYGSDPLQRYDVYLPAKKVHGAPVILMVHGGGWRRGSKSARGVVENKVARWVSRGFIFVSTNYRFIPAVTPLQEAVDVARALADAQKRAPSWGGDPHRFILMGHSAGAHLVALLAANPNIAREAHALPWLGTVSLDSAALNVVEIMQGRHPRLYDQAFGSNPADWLAASPFQQLRGPIAPFLAVCSSQRRDSCSRARAFVAKAESLGSHATVLPEDLRHGQINGELGLPSDYTRQVERFMATLDPAVAQLMHDVGRAPPAVVRD